MRKKKKLHIQMRFEPVFVLILVGGCGCGGDRWWLVVVKCA
jgi:hypothetical protein